jgi:hypothetical protein
VGYSPDIAITACGNAIMPRDTSWEDVWAEYDARQAGHAQVPPVAAPPSLEEAPRLQPRRLALGGLLALLVVLLGLPMGEAGAPAVASQEAPFQRHTMVAVGLSGEADMGESPATTPSTAVAMAEVALPPMVTPAWVHTATGPTTATTPSAQPTVPIAGRRIGQAPKRLARAGRPARQFAAVEAWPTGYDNPLDTPVSTASTLHLVTDAAGFNAAAGLAVMAGRTPNPGRASRI